MTSYLLSVLAPVLLTASSVVLDVQQGASFYLPLHTGEHAVSAEGILGKQRIPFFPTGRSGEMAALMGIDLGAKPGLARMTVTVRYADGREQHHHYTIRIRPGDFRVQHLELPKAMVDLNTNTLRRVRSEQKRVREVFAQVTGTRFWRGAFVLPVEGPVKGTFGSRRIVNGQPRSPHTGEDISAPEGTPVKVTNAGVVRLAEELFFSGNSVVVDHGLGLYTMYFHLAEMHVEQGTRVTKGQVIGTVGKTGRATGPHLHWGLRVNGARADPLDLLALDLRDGTP